MIVLDTDHLSLLEHPESDLTDRLTEEMLHRPDDAFVVTVISLEEQARAWLAAIRRARQLHDEPVYYARLAGLVEFYASWRILPFDLAASGRFLDLRARRVRIGTMDLKIASIALANDALLLSSNLRDFGQVPGLRVEDWVH